MWFNRNKKPAAGGAGARREIAFEPGGAARLRYLGWGGMVFGVVFAFNWLGGGAWALTAVSKTNVAILQVDVEPTGDFPDSSGLERVKRRELLALISARQARPRTCAMVQSASSNASCEPLRIRSRTRAGAQAMWLRRGAAAGSRRRCFRVAATVYVMLRRPGRLGALEPVGRPAAVLAGVIRELQPGVGRSPRTQARSSSSPRSTVRDGRAGGCGGIDVSLPEILM